MARGRPGGFEQSGRGKRSRWRIFASVQGSGGNSRASLVKMFGKEKDFGEGAPELRCPSPNMDLGFLFLTRRRIAAKAAVSN